MRTSKSYDEVDYVNHEGKRAIRKVVVRGSYFGTFPPYHAEPQWLLVVWDLDRQAERVYAQSGVLAWNGTPVPSPELLAGTPGRLWSIWWHGSGQRGDHVMELAEGGVTYSRELGFLGPDHHSGVEDVVREHNAQVRWLRAVVAVCQAQVATVRGQLDLARQKSVAESKSESVLILEDLVSRFSKVLLDKLKASEKKHGWSGLWMKISQDDCRHELLKHVGKGDPVDVAAFSAFAWHHGWSTTLEPWSCGASRNSGAGDPQDCSWPVCGCDPYASKVVEALQESGQLKQAETRGVEL